MKKYVVYWRLVESLTVYEEYITSNGSITDVIEDALIQIFDEQRIVADDIDICHVQVTE